MSKHNPSSSKKRFVLCMAALAVFCVICSVLLTSYFVSPSWFYARTAPLADAANRLSSFTSDIVSQIASTLKSPAVAQAPHTEESTLDVTQQLAVSPLFEKEYPLADPTITELRQTPHGEILTGGVYEIYYFNQSEEPWCSLPYGSDQIGGYGCGPTVMAMAVNSMTEQTTDPGQMASWSYDNRHWAAKHGSYHSLIPSAAEAFGLTCTSPDTISTQELTSQLLSGNLIVALMGPGHFTQGGHFILLHGITLSGKILVADPNSRERSTTEWDPQLIIEELSDSTSNGAPIWILSANPNY